ncbi:MULTISPECIES: DciA family protein [unclassified Thiocapsa]|uniref:DciA family protein n=1 Tax=unclassified Thiocapsa TaxID=2641286 RepID=UPI0035AE0BA1
MLHPGLAHVRELLQSNRLIRKHLEHRDRELALLGMVLSRLPDPLRAHCRDAVLADGVLTLFFDSPAWVTRARFLIEDLSRSLERDGVVKVATQVRIRTERDTKTGQPAEPAQGPAVPPSGGSRLSRRAIAHLLAAADGMPDPTLAEVFRRFANHHNPAAKTAAGDGRDEPLGAPDAGTTHAPNAD